MNKVSPKFYYEYRLCYRKAKFPDEKAAQKKANTIRWNDGKKDGELLKPYGCTRCGGWHLTKNQEVPSVL